MDVTGFEPVTSSMSTMRSNQLSYTSLTGYEHTMVALGGATILERFHKLEKLGQIATFIRPAKFI